MEYGFEKASLEGHKGKRRDSSRENVDPLASGGLSDGLRGGADIDPLVAGGSMSASAATESAAPGSDVKEPEPEALTVDRSQPPGQAIKEPADDEDKDDDAGNSNPAENSETESGESADSPDDNSNAPADGSDNGSDSPQSADKKADKKGDKKGGPGAAPATPAALADATVAVGGDHGGSAAAPVSTSDPVLAPAIGNPTDLQPSKEDAKGAGNANPAAAPVATDVPQLGGPETDSPAFTVDDVNMPKLDTSNYKSKRKAGKALEQYAQVQQVVDAKLATLIAEAQATVAELTTKIHAERDAHIAGLQASRGILAGNIQSARDALFAERDATSARVQAAIDVQRGAIKAQSTASQSQIRSAASALKSTVQKACDKSLNDYSTGYDGSKEDITTGIQDFKTSVAQRLQQANNELPIPGSDAIWTCVHYRVRQTLGKKFGASGPILEGIQQLRSGTEDNMLELYAEGQGKIKGVAGNAKSAADTAKSAGTSAIRSQERSALAALDITQTRIEGQLQTATNQGAASLDAVEANRNAAIDAAENQAHADAEQIRRRSTAAVWGCARSEAQRLIAATGNEAVDLAFKPKKETVEASLAAAQGVQLDISAACVSATTSVELWSNGHTTTRGDLDGSGAKCAQGWRDEALTFLTTAEKRAMESVTSTGVDSIQSLKGSAQKYADNLRSNGESAKGSLTRTVESQTRILRSIGTKFIADLDAKLGTAELKQIKPLRTAAYKALRSDFDVRTHSLYTAMFDAGLWNGTDEEAVFTALRGIGPYGAGALAQIYYELKKNRNLYRDLRIDLTRGEHKIAQAYLDANDGKGAKLELAYYQDGFFGDDEDAIKALLKSLSDDQLTDLKSQPGWEAAAEHLYANLSDDDLDTRVVKSLIAGNKARAEALELIDKITDARWNEDTEALRTAIAGIPADQRVAILTEFAVLQALATRKGGLDAVEFKDKDLDPVLAEQMGQAVTGADGKPITVINDDLTTRNVTEAEQRFGTWASQDNLKNDALYKEDGPGVGNRIKKSFTTTSGLLGTVAGGPLAGIMASSLDPSNQRTLDKEENDLIKNQAMFGTTSLQGRAAEVRYETTEGEDTEKAYDALSYDHKDENGESTNSAFKTAEEREKAHAEWKEAFDGVYKDQYKTSVSKDITKSGMSKRERKLLNETSTGGQASAETMFDYAENDGMGTREWAAKKALTSGSEADIAAYFKAHPEARKNLLSEFSGDEREEIEILMVGKVTNDRQRWKIAKIRWEFNRGTGSGNLLYLVSPAMGIASDLLPDGMAPKISANLFWDCISGSGTLMDFNYDTLKAMVDERGGEANAFDEKGNLKLLSQPGSDEAIEEAASFHGQESSLEAAESAYQNTMDVYTDLIATVAGLVVATILSIVTAGAASPMLVALASGLTTIATKAALKGDRYGWEEMAHDSALLALEVATAGLADKMTKLAKTDALLNLQKAGKAGNLTTDTIKLAKGVQVGLKTVETLVSSTGKVLLDETTYEKGFGEGFEKGIKQVGLDVSTVWMDAFIDGIGDKAFEKSIKNAKSNFTKDALTVTKTGVTTYGKGQAVTLLGDVLNGTDDFSKKQDKLATSAAFAALKKSMSVGSEREAKSANAVNDEVLADPEMNDIWKQSATEDKNEKNRKAEFQKGLGALTTTIAKSATEDN
jgi:hypothetical protein